jgi:hypothetical protein
MYWMKQAANRNHTVSLVCLALLLAGCAAGSQDIVGRWQAHSDQDSWPFIYELGQDGIGDLVWIPRDSAALTKPLSYSYEAQTGILEIQPIGETPQTFEFVFTGQNEATLTYRVWGPGEDGPVLVDAPVRFFRVAIPPGPIGARVALHNVIRDLDYEIFLATPVDDLQTDFPGYSVHSLTDLSFVAGGQVESWLFNVKVADESLLRSYVVMNAGSGWGVAELVLP